MLVTTIIWEVASPAAFLAVWENGKSPGTKKRVYGKMTYFCGFHAIILQRNSKTIFEAMKRQQMHANREPRSFIIHGNNLRMSSLQSDICMSSQLSYLRMSLLLSDKEQGKPVRYFHHGILPYDRCDRRCFSMLQDRSRKSQAYRSPSSRYTTRDI